MGLDLVEFAIEVEKRFDTTFPDADWQTLTTPRLLIDYIAIRANAVHSTAPCLSQRIFHNVRRGLIHRFNVARESIRLATSLETLVPKPRRREAWSALRTDLGVPKLPDLVLPRFLFDILTALTLSAGTAVFVGLFLLTSVWPALFLASLLALLTGYLLNKVVFPFRTEFSVAHQDVGGLVRFLLTESPADYLQTQLPPQSPINPPKWTREQIASIVHVLIVKNLGVDKYSEDSRFVEDMGID